MELRRGIHAHLATTPVPPGPDLTIQTVPAILLDVARLGLWLMLLAVIFVPLERLFGLRPAAIWRPGMPADLALYFLNSLLPGLVLSVPLAAIAWAAHAVIPTPFQEWMAALPLSARMAAGLVIGEIGFYWGHRWSHEIPFLWRFHAVHHRPDHLDWLVNTRAHPVDMVFTRLCGLVPLYAIGLGGPGSGPGPGSDSLVPVLIVIAGTVWGFFIHSNLRWRLGPVEHLLATPAFHHWHHTKSGPINSNYSAMLPCLDRLFRTHHLPKQWPEDYGIRPD